MGRRTRRRANRNGDPVAAIRILAVGRTRGPEGDLFDRYAGRHRPPLALIEIPDGTGAPAEIRRREARAILACLKLDTLMVALDRSGTSLSSEALAQALSTWVETSRDTAFVIGGAEGLDGSVLERAAFTLSLGPLTWPHGLARAMLAEQLYRARTILVGHPYHRG